MIKTSEELGSIIRLRRKSIGMRQKDILDFASFGSTFLSELENGKPTVQLDKLLEAVYLLGLKLIIESPTDITLPLEDVEE
jgi:transcriptional regulator with XRE-family HTH domain